LIARMSAIKPTVMSSSLASRGLPAQSQ